MLFSEIWGGKGPMCKKRLISIFISLGFLLCLAAVPSISGQAVSTYTFTPSSGTFTPLAGATSLVLQSGDADDGRYAAVPIGFTFNYAGTNYTQVGTCSNGWMSLLPATNFARNNDLDGTIGGATRPFVAPFFDDIDMTLGSVSYLTTGSAPNRVFTMQWLNAKWDYTGTAPAISFQAKLFETTNRVQFVYRQEAGAIGIDVNSFGASIGIAAAATGSGNYLSLNNSGASPAASSTVNTMNIATKPANGQIYTFAPPATASNSSISGRVLTNDGRALRNAIVSLTNSQGTTQTARTSSFGMFRFGELESGQTVIISVKSKQYVFVPQAVSVFDDITDLILIAQP
jgi:hypothetical protein